ncbi:MAG: S-layer homology domain-containing protein, partial [Actinobacteria bacterium]|nr:S-layer homology domain-containing protein [Actinomycetota bacterium]
MTGYPDETFKPDNMISRAEIASTIVRAYKFNEPQFADSYSFPDTLNHWAEQNIRVANQNGIIEGYSSGLFRPDGQATRAETSVVVARAIYASEPIHANEETKISGSIQLTAQNWRYEDEIGTWSPPVGKRFLSLDVIIENVGSDTVHVNDNGFGAYLADGQKIGVDSTHYHGDDFKAIDLATNASETGTITFSVPKDADIAYIAYDYLGVKFPIKV